MSRNDDRGFTVRALGEIAIRCTDIEAMERFYRDVIGLQVLPGGHRDGIVFFSLGESYGGHSAILALFRHDAPLSDMQPSIKSGMANSAGSSLHHLALTIDEAEQEAVIAWYDRQGLDHTVQSFEWVGWRGVFTTDPEGNTVELVAKISSSTSPDTE